MIQASGQRPFRPPDNPSRYGPGSCLWSYTTFRGTTRANERQGENFVPQLNDERGKFEQLLRLTLDDVVAALLIHLGRVKPELVKQLGGGPCFLAKPACIIGNLLR